jgi:hypothetical protein
MQLIEGFVLSQLCDYSFGDQGGQWGNIYTSFMKDANLLNLEFIEKVFETKKIKNYMTIFIDNIRLYKRHIVEVKDQDRPVVESLMETSDLLNLCSQFPDMKFIVFTNLEDTPIDEYIFDKIPENVLSINAANAVSYGGKVNPIPYGVQRRLTSNDNRIEILTSFMQKIDIIPKNILYVNHSINTNPKERSGISELFLNKSWAKVEQGNVNYNQYLSELENSKFMICPIGNAIDCHRNWETLYMRRVPIMKKNNYLEYLFRDYPVLFVENYSDVTENLLIENDYLFQEAQQMNMKNLDLLQMYDKIIKSNTCNL